MKKKIITISREFGSGGRSIAKEVAKQLGFAYYDKELIKKTAEKTGFDEKYIEDHGEYASGKTFLSYVAGIFGSTTRQLSAADFLYVMQRQVILDLAEQGNCVIVGRCADYILRDREGCLNIFIHADEPYKAERIVRLYGETEKSPEERLREKDAKRQVNYKHYTDREWGKCQNYHLSLNSGVIGEEKCVSMIAGLANNLE